MKKYLIYLTIFLSSFFIIEKVSAADYTELVRNDYNGKTFIYYLYNDQVCIQRSSVDSPYQKDSCYLIGSYGKYFYAWINGSSIKYLSSDEKIIFYGNNFIGNNMNLVDISISSYPTINKSVSTSLNTYNLTNLDSYKYISNFNLYDNNNNLLKFKTVDSTVGSEIINFDFGTKNYNSLINNWCNTNDVENFYNTNYKNTYKYYVYSTRMTGFGSKGLLLWNDTDFRLGFDSRYYNNKPAMWFYYINPNRSPLKFVFLTCNSSGAITSSSESNITDMYGDVQFWNYQGRNALEDLNTNYSIDFSFKTNVPILFYDKETYNQYNPNIRQQYDLFTYKGVDYRPGDYVFNSDFTPYTEITTPTVSITKDSETTVTVENQTFISSVTLNIEFSRIDNEQYLYLYKYGLDSDWSTITLTQSNSFKKTFTENDTLYVQVIDQLTHEVVSSSTYTITSINYKFEPYVDVVETTPSACFFYKNGRSYSICKNLNISAKNLTDGNFTAFYSYDLIDWFNFTNIDIPINENKTIYFKITNYLTNEVSYTSTYTVSSIDTDISELGVFNTYTSTYDKDTSYITAYINIYNLLEPVSQHYKIYYSYNSTSFIEITYLLNYMNNYYQFEIDNINENKIIYFKITDLNDNILYTSTYTINYQIEANENINFFSSFRTNFHGLSDIISVPLYAIKKINTGVCSPLEIPIPYTNENIALPCMTTVYESNMPEILNIWQIVTNGIISYYIILDLFRMVKSFKEPEEDKIEVVDL